MNATPTPRHVTCAHQGCVCVIPRDQALQRDRQYFCSEECAEGAGCDHNGCSCGIAVVPDATGPAPESAEEL
jgi:hypothetical protein